MWGEMMKYFKNTYCSALITITILLLSLIINFTTAHAVKYKKFNFSYIPDKSYPKLHIYAKDGKWVGATSKEVKLNFLVDISIKKPTIWLIQGYRIEIPGSNNNIVDNYIENKTFTIDWPTSTFPGKNFGSVV